ncbi:MAG: c-type cytochrome [Methyloprofundus sp.]|nr:c-type cytochrome [Methyloprofundus sp.]
MKRSLLVVTASLALLSMTGVAQAAADINAGQQKSASCGSCHGKDGNSVVPMFPKLAAQNEEYLVKQMQAFKDGSRAGATMGAMVQGLSTKDMQDIAAYYEAQQVTNNVLPPLDFEDEDDDGESLGKKQLAANKQAAEEQQNALISIGFDVYRNGDLDNEISACIACHGPYGEGNKPASFPALKGQHADYVIKTLTDFKTGVRSNNPENMMHMITKKMSNKEIKALSYYISGLR